MLRRAIHPRALQHAVAALNVPDVQNVQSYRSREETCIHFMNQYAVQHPDIVSRLPGPAYAMSLARLHKSVSRIARDYMTAKGDRLLALSGLN